MDKREFALSDIFSIAIKWLWMIVVGAVVCGAIAYYYNSFVVVPLYRSTTKMFVQTKDEGKSANVVDSQRSFAFGQMVVSDYMDIFKTYTFAEEVAFYLAGNTKQTDSAQKSLRLQEIDLENLSQTYTAGQLYSMISYSAKEESALFTIQVIGKNHADCQIIAECLEIVVPGYLDEITSGVALLNVVDHARSSSSPINDKTRTNTLISIIMGAALAFVIAFVIEVNDTRVKDDKHLAEVFRIPVIGSIPDCAAVGTTEYKSTKYTDVIQNQK